MKYIPASVYNALSEEEKTNLWLYFEFLGKRVPNAIKGHTSTVEDSLTFPIRDCEVRVAFSREGDDNYTLEEVRNMSRLMA